MKTALIAVAIGAMIVFGIGSSVYAWHGGCWSTDYDIDQWGPGMAQDYSARPAVNTGTRGYGWMHGYYSGYGHRGRGMWNGGYHGMGMGHMGGW